MPLNTTIRFFDKLGTDMNLGSTYSVLTSLYTGATSSIESMEGSLFFPKVSTGLIESQQMFLLQEVSGPTASYELRKIQGTAIITGGSPTVAGTDSDFSILYVGNTVKIGDNSYSVVGVSGTASFTISPTPSDSITTTDIYYYDYISYTQLRTSPGSFSESLVASIVETQEEFFLYDVIYDEEYPYITRSFSSQYELADGSGDAIDPNTGRVELSISTITPTQINVGFSSGSTASYDDIFEKTLNVSFEKEYVSSLSAMPIVADNVTFIIGGTSHDLYTTTEFYFQGLTGATSTFYDKQLTNVTVGISGSNTYIYADLFNIPGIAILSEFRILWKNSETLATFNMYAETEAEDERFKVVLENFGKKIDLENEYIFRESDIHEELIDYKALNVKRKELLLEGDNIYPYMGSYKALINIINFFGYYDLKIKEYFLNVDTDSSNFGKYLHILVPRDDVQRKQVRTAWELLPSKVYKKTSLFGLFYDLNRITDIVDDYGIPEVEDVFDFSPEEVLIKLFGLKELLKKQYLPLNAKIYDITGEGIYFERIRIDTWSDNLNHLVLNIGKTPEFTIFPNGYTYITDLRRIDKYYVDKLSEQGLVGFLGTTSSVPGLTANGATMSISTYYQNSLGSFDHYVQGQHNELVDNTWTYFPPSIDDEDFNFLASRTLPLPDDKGILAGGPILLECDFDITWDESDFTWSQIGILGPSGAPLNINLWTWESIGRGQFMDMRWIVEKGGSNGFRYDSGRIPIDDFLVRQNGTQNYAVTAALSVGVSGGSVNSVSITNPGFGYDSTPVVSVSIPGGTGTSASISVYIDENGYMTGATVTSGGSGYNFTPFVFVESPTPTYNIDYRYLHALAVPYEGIYDVSLYTYDITNNFSVNFKKYEAKSWNVDFVSIARSETSERLWENFKTVSWDDVTGPWYYPLHVDSVWDDAKTSWESLNFSTYDGNTLFEYALNTKILEINRESEYVILQGDLTGNLANQNVLNVGDYLFFTRESSDLITSGLEIPADSFTVKLTGLSGSIEYTVPVQGASGASELYTYQYDTQSYLSTGDQLYLKTYVGSTSSVSKWYTVSTVGATTISLNSVLEGYISLTCSSPDVYPLDGLITSTCTGTSSVSMESYSRIISTMITDYNSIDPTADFYGYLDGLTANGTEITVKGLEETSKDMIQLNSSNGAGESLYFSWGLFSGTYAIQITSIGLTGNNTRFRLSDVNKELYYIDGNYDTRLADYDVDYAETRIGVSSLNYENATEINWEENDSMTWFGLEYHGGTLCGYVIPFVSPGGSITVDENPTFSFSGDFAIDSTKDGLGVAADELNASLIAGISNYDYAVLPNLDLTIKDFTGTDIDVDTAVIPGDTQIILSAIPDGGQLKIQATVTVTVTSGVVTGATVTNPGWGYRYAPIITVPYPGGTGTSAVLSCTLSGLPYQGVVSSVSIVSGGSGYTASPAVDVLPPDDFKEFDNYVWTGMEWLEIESVSSNTLTLAGTATYPISIGDFLLLPYQYHKQLFTDTDRFQQFYYFIHGKAKTPSNEMLSYINLLNGVESEWLEHPSRTYTYPLRNSFLFQSESKPMENDMLFKKWEYEGSDYPPLTIDVDYSSDTLSYESRIPYSQTLQSSYSYIDTVISSQQRVLKPFTPVIFSFDECNIPGKINPVWTISDENTGIIEVMSSEEKLMWNFTKKGNYTVSLKLEDSNGNVSIGKKNSFIVV